MEENKGYSQKWVCEFCQQPYDTEEEAKKCSETHEELKFEPEMVIGDMLPSRIRVCRTQGVKILAQEIYVKVGQCHE